MLLLCIVWKYKWHLKQAPLPCHRDWYTQILLHALCDRYSGLSEVFFIFFLDPNYVKDGWNLSCGLKCPGFNLSLNSEFLFVLLQSRGILAAPFPLSAMSGALLCVPLILFPSQCRSTVCSQAHLSPCGVRSLWGSGSTCSAENLLNEIVQNTLFLTHPLPVLFPPCGHYVFFLPFSQCLISCPHTLRRKTGLKHWRKEFLPEKAMFFRTPWMMDRLRSCQRQSCWRCLDLKAEQRLAMAHTCLYLSSWIATRI